MADALPKPALAPILVFVAPRHHGPELIMQRPNATPLAVTFAVLPSVAQLVQIFFIAGLQRRADVGARSIPRGHDEGDRHHESGFHRHRGCDGSARARIHSHGHVVGWGGRISHRSEDGRGGGDARGVRCPRALPGLSIRSRPLAGSSSAVDDRIHSALSLVSRPTSASRRSFSAYWGEPEAFGVQGALSSCHPDASEG